MSTFLRWVTKNVWRSLFVGVLALLLGVFAVVSSLTGAVENGQMIRYLLFGILFIGFGVFGIMNALQLRAKAGKQT